MKNANKMKCQYCGENKKLIKAHIIPASFFKPLRADNGDVPYLMSDLLGVFPKKSQTGVYDRTILCRACEDKFAQWDEFGFKTLVDSAKQLRSLRYQRKLLAFILPQVDIDQLKRFLLSVLWRASVSSQDFYKQVNLGAYEDKIQSILENNTALDKDEYSFFLSRFDDQYFGSTMLDPRHECWDGVNYHRIYLGGFIAHIKVDKRPSSPSFAPFIQQDTSDLIVLARELKTSAEFEIMKQIVKQNLN